MKAVFILLGIGGLAAVSYGAYILHPAAGWIVSGIITLLLAQGWSRLYNSKKKGSR